MSELIATSSGEIRARDALLGYWWYEKYEADKVIARQKYKRCLAMAEMCKAMYDKEDASVNGYGVSWEYISKEMKYWERWRWRWEALAEKFNEAK